jgi:hypothetical protein
LDHLVASFVGVEYAAHGPFHETWWFRVSFFETIALGALNGMALRGLRRFDATATTALRRMARRGWVMTVLLAQITVLMELKPW